MKASFNKWDGRNWHVRVDHGLMAPAPAPGSRIMVSKRDGGMTEVRLGVKVAHFNARTTIFAIVPEPKRKSYKQGRLETNVEPKSYTVYTRERGHYPHMSYRDAAALGDSLAADGIESECRDENFNHVFTKGER